jgi:superfamily II DNA or RNA helicase
MEPPPIVLSYEGGTVIVAGADQSELLALPHCQADPRSVVVRAEGRHYRALVEHLWRSKIPFTDEARAWDKEKINWTLKRERKPFPHQTEALETWWKTGGRGLVVLPTGTGKTFVAILAIQRAGRPALVVTPTIDLLHQWYSEMVNYFGEPIGLLGGGYYDPQTLTVTTYDSAHIYLERWAHKYGLLVLDECHHLPGPSYSNIALGSLAPYRLGLTATPERADGQEIVYPGLVGPIVYRREIRELAGDFLAEYRTERVYVDLTPEELEHYQTTRETFRRFVAEAGIQFGGPNGWQNFINATSRSVEGRTAFKAYREQRRLALAAPAKLRELEKLLEQHRGDRVLIFTYDNATVYTIARRFLVPAITHQTKTKERKQILESFHSGELNVLVTSQVLNEGVDVPAANVGIILSGTATVREHVQRLGRLLRKHGEKQALLYEVIARGTAEEFVSERRRQHHAYR